MADIRITPASSIMAFTSSLSFKETLTQDASGSIVLYGSGSTGRTNVFAIDGGSGRLFSVDDSLSDSLFSVNTIAGLPVIEAFADNTVNIGKYGAYSFVATGSGDARIGSGSVMFVSASGNVGIGTTSPGYKLDVVGDIRLQGNNQVYFDTTSDSASNYIGITNDYWLTLYCGRGNNSRIDLTNGTGILFSESGTERMRVNAGGNVGIGTTSPDSKLHVSTTASNPFRMVRTGGTATNFGFEFGGGDIGLYNYSTSAYGWFLTAAGLVGIGTTSLTYKFEVHNNATANAALLYSSTSATTVAIGSTSNTNNANVIWYTDSGTGQIFRGGTGFSAWAGALSLNIYNSNGPIGFHPGATANALYLTTGGLVGIGTNSPLNLLHVSQASANTIFRLGNNASYDQFIYFNGGNDWSLGMDYSNSNAFVLSNASSIGTNDRLVVTTGGNVGIGTTNPSEKLAVAGAITSTSIIYTSAGSLLARASGTEGAQYQLNGITVGYSATGTYGWLTAGGAAARTSLALNAGGGNVGIGTTNPSFNLDIAGSARAFVGAGTTNYNYFQVAEIGANLYGRFHYIPSGFSTAGLTLANSVLINAADGATAGLVIRTDANAPIIFGTNQTSEKMRITGPGAVGIGTTNPGTNLEVYSSNAIVRITNTNANSYSELHFNEGGTVKAELFVVGSTQTTYGGSNSLNIYQASNAPIAFFTNGGNERMRITGAGNVGIGTTSPQALLDVNGGDGTPAGTQFTAVIKGTSSRTLYFDGGGSGASVWWGDGNSPQFAIDSISGGGAAFWTNDGSWSERMRITSAGNVGIGTTNPSTKLDVVGANIRTDKAFMSQGSNAAWSGAACFMDYIPASSYGRIGVYDYGEPTWQNLYVGGGGKVGIGTTTFTYKLNLLGDLYITGGSIGVGVAPNATDGRIDASNDIVAYSTSDIRFKENTQRIPNALDKVNTLSGNTFTWKPDPELTKLHGFEGNDVGIIAQEIEAILPDIVTTRDSGYKAVKYEKLVPLLIEAIKELTNKVNKLENK